MLGMTTGISYLLQTYIVIIFTEKAKLRHCQDVEKIIQEFGIQTTLEIVR